MSQCYEQVMRKQGKFHAFFFMSLCSFCVCRPKNFRFRPFTWFAILLAREETKAQQIVIIIFHFIQFILFWFVWKNFWHNVGQILTSHNQKTRNWRGSIEMPKETMPNCIIIDIVVVVFVGKLWHMTRKVPFLLWRCSLSQYPYIIYCIYIFLGNHIKSFAQGHFGNN